MDEVWMIYIGYSMVDKERGVSIIYGCWWLWKNVLSWKELDGRWGWRGDVYSLVRLNKYIVKKIG
jgi:hypothetical protein